MGAWGWVALYSMYRCSAEGDLRSRFDLEGAKPLSC